MNREDYVLMGPLALMRRCEALEADAARLDWLEKEMERELTCTTHLIGRPQGISLFRRNMPITRAAIDEAMKQCHEE